jgi:hypothetical protein
MLLNPPLTSASATDHVDHTDHTAQDQYTCRINALIEHGREDLVGDVLDEAEHELGRPAGAGERPRRATGGGPG